MALAQTVVTVGTSAVALFTAGPTNVVIKNLNLGTVYLGISGAGNQTFPLGSGGELRLTIAATDVVYAVADAAGRRVAVFTS
jgi:hypothetical protein